MEPPEGGLTPALRIHAERAWGETGIRLVEGDITLCEADAIVNAANAHLAGGGGVDGAIHRAGGPEIMRACDTIRAKTGGCRTGSAVATVAGALRAQYVFHAVGPVYRGRPGDAELLADAYGACLALAKEKNIRTIAFPSLSTGAYGYPLGEAAPIALRTVREFVTAHPGALERVDFCLRGDAVAAFRQALAAASSEARR